jgi:hypothetical protein
MLDTVRPDPREQTRPEIAVVPSVPRRLPELRVELEEQALPLDMTSDPLWILAFAMGICFAMLAALVAFA